MKDTIAAVVDGHPIYLSDLFPYEEFENGIAHHCVYTQEDSFVTTMVRKCLTEVSMKEENKCMKEQYLATITRGDGSKENAMMRCTGFKKDMQIH